MRLIALGFILLSLAAALSILGMQYHWRVDLASWLAYGGVSCFALAGAIDIWRSQ